MATYLLKYLLLFAILIQFAQASVTWSSPYYFFANNILTADVDIRNQGSASEINGIDGDVLQLTLPIGFTRDTTVSCTLIFDPTASYVSIPVSFQEKEANVVAVSLTASFSFTAGKITRLTCSGLKSPINVIDTWIYTFSYIRSGPSTLQTLQFSGSQITPFQLFAFGSKNQTALKSRKDTIPVASTNSLKETITLTNFIGQGPKLLSTDVIKIEFPEMWEQSIKSGDTTSVNGFLLTFTTSTNTYQMTSATRNGQMYSIEIPLDAIFISDDLTKAVNITLSNFIIPSRPLSTRYYVKVWTETKVGLPRTGPSLAQLPSVTAMVLRPGTKSFTHSTSIVNTWGSILFSVKHDNLLAKPGNLIRMLFPGSISVDPWRFKRLDADADLSGLGNSYAQIKCLLKSDAVNGTTIFTEEIIGNGTVPLAPSLINDNVRIVTGASSGDKWLEIMLPRSISQEGELYVNCSGIATPATTIGPLTTSVEFAEVISLSTGIKSVYASFASLPTDSVYSQGSVGTTGISFSLTPSVSNQVSTLAIDIPKYSYSRRAPNIIFSVHLPGGFSTTSSLSCISIPSAGMTYITEPTPTFTPHLEVLKFLLSTARNDADATSLRIECTGMTVPRFVMNARNDLKLTLSVRGDYVHIPTTVPLPSHGLTVFPEEFIIASNSAVTMGAITSAANAASLKRVVFYSPFTESKFNEIVNFTLEVSPMFVSGSTIIGDTILKGDAIEFMLPASSINANNKLTSCSLKLNTDSDINSQRNNPDISYEYSLPNTVLLYDASKLFMRVRARFNVDYQLSSALRQREVVMTCSNLKLPAYGALPAFNGIYTIVDVNNRTLIANTTVLLPAVTAKPFAIVIATANENSPATFFANTTTSGIKLFLQSTVDVMDSEFQFNTTYYQFEIKLSKNFTLPMYTSIDCTSMRGATLINSFTANAYSSADGLPTIRFPLLNLASPFSKSTVYTLTCRNIIAPMYAQPASPISISILSGPNSDISNYYSSTISAVTGPKVIDSSEFGSVIAQSQVTTLTTGYRLNVTVSPIGITSFTTDHAIDLRLPPAIFGTYTLAETDTCIVAVNDVLAAPIVSIAGVGTAPFSNGRFRFKITTALSVVATDSITFQCTIGFGPVMNVDIVRDAVIDLLSTSSGTSVLKTVTNAIFMPYTTRLYANGGGKTFFSSPNSVGSVGTYNIQIQHTSAAQTSIPGTIIRISVPTDTIRLPTTPSSAISCTNTIAGGSTTILDAPIFEYPFTFITVNLGNSLSVQQSTGGLGVTFTVSCSNIRAPRHFNAETLTVRSYSNDGNMIARNTRIQFTPMSTRVMESPLTISVVPPYVKLYSLLPPTTDVQLIVELEKLPFPLQINDTILFDFHPGLTFLESSQCFVDNVLVTSYVIEQGSVSEYIPPTVPVDPGFDEDDTEDQEAPPDPGDFIPVSLKKSKKMSFKPMSTSGPGYASRGNITMLLPVAIPTTKNPVISCTNVFTTPYSIPAESDYSITVHRNTTLLATTSIAAFSGIFPARLGTSSIVVTVPRASSFIKSGFAFSISPLELELSSSLTVDLIYPSKYTLAFDSTIFPPTSCSLIRQLSAGTPAEAPITLRFSSRPENMFDLSGSNVVLEHTVVSFDIPTLSITVPRTDPTGSITISCSQVQMPHTKMSAVIGAVGIRSRVSALVSNDEPLAQALTTTLTPTDYLMFSNEAQLPNIAYTTIGSQYLYVSTENRVAGQDSGDLTVSIRPLPISIPLQGMLQVIIPRGNWIQPKDTLTNVLKPQECTFQYRSAVSGTYLSIPGTTSVNNLATKLTIEFKFTSAESGIYETSVVKLVCKNIHLPLEPISTALDNIIVNVLTTTSTSSTLVMQNNQATMHTTIKSALALSTNTLIVQTFYLNNLPAKLSPSQLDNIVNGYNIALQNAGFVGTKALLKRVFYSNSAASYIDDDDIEKNEFLEHRNIIKTIYAQQYREEIITGKTNIDSLLPLELKSIPIAHKAFTRGHVSPMSTVHCTIDVIMEKPDTFADDYTLFLDYLSLSKNAIAGYFQAQVPDLSISASSDFTILDYPIACSDNEYSNFESDTDCGGPNCKQCDAFKLCNSHNDCLSGLCQSNSGSFPTCYGVILKPNDASHHNSILYMFISLCLSLFLLL